jgi:hypothetical protein
VKLYSKECYEMKTRFGYLCIAAIFVMSSSARAKDPLADLYGTWKIQAIIGGGAASSILDREARQLIGKTFQVKAKRFIFNGYPCTETSYEETIEETAGHFEREWNTEVKDLPLPDPVTVIETGCNTLYRLKNGKLMVAEKGMFFEAARIKRSAHH